MRPSQVTLRLILVWIGLGLFANVWPQTFGLLWLLTAGILALLLVADAFTLPRTRQLHLQRQLPSRFALGAPSTVSLQLSHQLGRPLQLQLIDGLPTTAHAPTLPWQGTLPPHQTIALRYELHFTQRGQHTLTPAHLLTLSRFRLWQRAHRVGPSSPIRCYPNYQPLVRYALLAMANHTSQMGIIKRSRVGTSLDFQQLRDYQDGDTLSRIDWKATARRNTLISRQFEEQRHQTLLLVPDCGRRMRALDGELTQFDHSLNAMLLLSYIALRQGDEVSILNFGGQPRWLKPVKGSHAMPIVLDHLYDYQTTTQPSDFTEAAQRILTHQKRRALVVFLTNLRTEDSSHLQPAVQLLRRRHRVLIATLSEQELTQRAQQPIDSLNSALGYAAYCAYQQERALLLRTLRSQRIHLLDTTAQNLPIALTNRYLDLKASGHL